MTRITNADQIALILRTKLRKPEKLSPHKTRANAAPAEVRQNPTDRVQALLAKDEGIDERKLREALVRALLIEEFGPEMVDDPRFAALVSTVLSRVESDEGTKALLQEALEHLKS